VRVDAGFPHGRNRVRAILAGSERGGAARSSHRGQCGIHGLRVRPNTSLNVEPPGRIPACSTWRLQCRLCVDPFDHGCERVATVVAEDR